jgi:hypothetical protein
MKYFIIAVVVLGVVLGGIALRPKATQYVAPEVIEKEVTVEVETLSRRIEEALTASSTAIEAEAKRAYEDKKTQLMREVELAIRTQYEGELRAERVKLEKELMTY